MPSSSSKPASKPSKPLSQPQSSPQPKPSSLSSHLAMVELKTRILSLLSKLSDRDTYQIAVDELEKIICSLPADGFPVLLSSLLLDPASPAGDSSSAAIGRNISRRESVRLLSLLCSSNPDAAAPHLSKIITHIVRRLKDPASESSVRDACRDATGSLAALYLCSHANEACSGGEGRLMAPTSVVGLFVKPLLDVMGEQNKTVQVGAAMCLAKVVECGGGDRGVGAVAFQKLCPRICKLLGGQSFVAKGALLSVISSLAQIGAISPHCMPTALQNIHECLENSDWVARKSAADALIVMASHSGHLIADGTSQIITSLEACRFDKVKPVRDSIMEALQLWKKVSGNDDDNAPEESIGYGEGALDNKPPKLNSKRSESTKDFSFDSSCAGNETLSKGKCNNIQKNAAVILKKKVPSLKDKELNPEFFQNLEIRSSNDVPVEVVLPRRCLESYYTLDERYECSESESRISSGHDGIFGGQLNENNGLIHSPGRKVGTNNNKKNLDCDVRDNFTEIGFRSRDSKLRARPFDADESAEVSQGSFAQLESISRTNIVVEDPDMNNKGNWLAIQRQLSQLEMQQDHLLDMLQNLMGGSHDSLVTLENRVRGLEGVVEEMVQDLSISSSSRRGGDIKMGIEGSPGRSSIKYNGLQDYAGSKFSRGNDRILFSERYHSSDGMAPGTRGRDTAWRPDSEGRNPFVYSAPRHGGASARRGLVASLVDGRFKSEPDADLAGNRRAWGKDQNLFRLGEGPSARSVWQASKDEATLEAIRVAGDDNGASLAVAQGSIDELDAETATCDNSSLERGPLWVSWTRAMHLLRAGNVNSAFSEVLSTGDDALLVKLMERSGPVIDELSGEIASELLLAVGQFVLEQSLFDIALAWIQQLRDLVMENGEDFLVIPIEIKREILLNLREVSTMESPNNWEGTSAVRIMLQLASSWGINIRKLTR